MGELAARASAVGHTYRPAFSVLRCGRVVGLRSAGVVVAVVLTAVTLGSGIASADPLIGKRYSDAVSWISQRNGKPVVTTVSGSQLALDDCIVSSWTQGGFRNSRGRNDRWNEFYLHLNCNKQLASAGHPGNSLASPDGKKRKKQEDWAASINEHPEQCRRSEAAFENCRSFCERTKLCTITM